ncbi:MAG: glycosyltransferase, partial [Fimbriimonadales bacterium]
AQLPILATTVGGIPEAITDGVEGWLVPPKDPDALVHALIEIIENPDERARRAQNAHQRVCESFTVESQVAKIEAILEQVVQAHR